MAFFLPFGLAHICMKRRCFAVFDGIVVVLVNVARKGVEPTLNKGVDLACP